MHCNGTCPPRPPGCELIYSGFGKPHFQPYQWLSKHVFIPGSGSDLTYVPNQDYFWYPFLKEEKRKEGLPFTTLPIGGLSYMKYGDFDPPPPF